MTQTKFMELLTQNLRKYFLPEEYDIQGDLFLKNNDTKRHGLVIRRIGETIAPTIYTDHFYKDYIKKKRTIEEITCQIRQILYGFEEKGQTCRSFSASFDACRPNIIYRLISLEKNHEYLSGIPHIPFLNLAILFVVVHQLSEEGLESICITKQLQDKWNVSTKELYQIAAANTPRLLPPSISTMAHAIETFFGEETRQLLENEKPIPHIYIVSNKYGINGATSLLYENLIQNLAQEKQQNFYVLPSSIHEILLIPDITPGALSRLSGMVKEINENHVKKDEVLSDQAYYYDRFKKRFLIE